MRTPRTVAAAAAIALVGWMAVANTAAADMTKDQCIDANSKAQDLRRDQKFALARESLRACMSASCPALVRSDCTKRLDDLDRAQPSVAFEVKDASGADVTAVKVTVDGVPFIDELDGSAHPVDPGRHVFVFQVAGRSPVSRTFVITEGEKDRRERIPEGDALAPPPVPPSPSSAPATTGAPSAAAGPSAVPAPIASPPQETSTAAGGMGTQRVLGLVVGGVGIAGLAVGGVFGGMAFSQKSQQESACSSPCSAASHSQAETAHSNGLTDATVSTVGFIAGGALLLGGLFLYLTGGGETTQHSTAGVRLAPAATPEGGGVQLVGRF